MIVTWGERRSRVLSVLLTIRVYPSLAILNSHQEQPRRRGTRPRLASRSGQKLPQILLAQIPFGDFNQRPRHIANHMLEKSAPSDAQHEAAIVRFRPAAEDSTDL